MKVEISSNGHVSKSNCPYCNSFAPLWLDRGEWTIDTDNGLRGFPARYCPNCGGKLPLWKWEDYIKD